MAGKSGLGKATDGAGSDTAKPRAKKVTTDQIIAQSAAQGGKCYVLGTPLGNGSAMVDGKLIGKVANDARGGRSLAELKAKLTTDMLNADALIKTFGGLRSEKGLVTFAGEKKVSTDSGETGKPAAEEKV